MTDRSKIQNQNSRFSTPTKIADLLNSGVLVINDGYRAKNSELSDSGIPFARAQNINDGFNFENADRFPESDLHKVGIKVSQPGDVVFTSKGTVGRFAFVREDTPRFVYSPQLCFWRVLKTDRIDPQWLFYWMSSREFYVQFSGVANQTDMAEYVNLRDQRSMNIILPQLEEQRRIAHILGTIDHKIEMNRKISGTLETIARSIFQSWFIDFDPVRAKIENKQPKGMDNATASMFPDLFEIIEGVEVPQGWRVEPLSDSSTIRMGQSPPGTTYNENGVGIPFFQGRTDFGFRYPSIRIYCTSPTRYADKGDTLVSVRAPVGDINLTREKCCIGRGVASVRHKTGSRSFTYYQMLSFQEVFAKFESEGTVFGSINKADFNSIKCITPPNKIVKKFEETIFPLDQMIEINDEQSRKLIAIRDSLSPRLMSGEITPDDKRNFTEVK